MKKSSTDKAAAKVAKVTKAPKVSKPAKKAPAAGDEVLQERTGKLIVRDGATVLKIFGPEYKVSDSATAPRS